MMADVNPIVALLGEQVQGKDGLVQVSSLKKEGVLGLYFSAHWCPPCRGFTPKLGEWYTKFKKSENGDKLEIVFVSSDREQNEFDDYYKDMPWLALSFDKRDTKTDLGKKYGVSGIPTLVFLDSETGDIITKNARNLTDLGKKYDVSGIPTLVFLDSETGDLITKNARNLVEKDPEGTQFPWKST